MATDPDIQIVCELMGGTGLAREVTLAALAPGQDRRLGQQGADLRRTARRSSTRRGATAAISSSRPASPGASRSSRRCARGLSPNRFPRIYGILNGTCNYILTQMATWDAPTGVLAEAKRLGYAEADESLDVEGWDTAHKASILAWLAHGVWVRPDQMIVEGIDRITPADFKNAAALGYGIKLLAVISRDFQTRRARACGSTRRCCPHGGVIARVSGVFNAISVTGDVVGTTLYIGRGAGQDATASAVISDIADGGRAPSAAAGRALAGRGRRRPQRAALPPRAA